MDSCAFWFKDKNPPRFFPKPPNFVRSFPELALVVQTFLLLRHSSPWISSKAWNRPLPPIHGDGSVLLDKFFQTTLSLLQGTPPESMKGNAPHHGSIPSCSKSSLLSWTDFSLKIFHLRSRFFQKDTTLLRLLPKSLPSCSKIYLLFRDGLLPKTRINTWNFL